MVTLYILRLGILITPIALVVVISKEGGWKYGFTFIQNKAEVGIYIGFAMSFILTTYHALSYESIGQGPLSNYLKSKQRVWVKGTIGLDQLEQEIGKQYSIRDVERGENHLHFRKRALFMPPDRMTVERRGGEIFISSRPFVRWWFMDFGRNFKNVKQIAALIQA